MKILGTRIDHVTMQEAMHIATDGMKDKPPFVVVTPNSEIVVKANENLLLMNIIDNAGLVVPDGIGLVIGSKLVGQPLRERVTGIDLMDRLLAYATDNGSRIFFLGGKPTIAERAAEHTIEKYRNINIVGTHHGYFKGMHTGDPEHSDERAVVELIKSLDVDMLFVALGAPNQELFIDRYKDELGAKLLMGVGGSLDVISGTVKRAPEFWQKIGMEWLYRMIKEPVRIKRAGALPIFAVNVLIHRDKPMKKK
ncbi:MAG: WecB/TagA/CpsF family glycosyltransferase [Peptostreptococcaceae bacterium]|nr:WecB/TagA/CpsF family glycosyltransferase [Peptostreptococcaceae bacterium]